MRKACLPIPDLLRQLESFYGRQEPCWPTAPYLFLVWWHCGYPASDAACAKGWESLNREIGVEPHQLLAALPANLATALRPGGMVHTPSRHTVPGTVLRLPNMPHHKETLCRTPSLKGGLQAAWHSLQARWRQRRFGKCGSGFFLLSSCFSSLPFSTAPTLRLRR